MVLCDIWKWHYLRIFILKRQSSQWMTFCFGLYYIFLQKCFSSHFSIRDLLHPSSPISADIILFFFFFFFQRNSLFKVIFMDFFLSLNDPDWPDKCPGLGSVSNIMLDLLWEMSGPLNQCCLKQYWSFILFFFFFFRIMMMSVLKHTKTPVKFWFLKNYLSPTFKVRMATEKLITTSLMQSTTSKPAPESRLSHFFS